MMNKTLHFGIRANFHQIAHHLLQVLLVGMTIGMMRTVVPALAESEFGVPRRSYLLLVTFVVAFGLVKGVMNFVAGRLAERIGRRRVLLLGWLIAWPIPAIIYFAPSWNWIVFATMLLGVNQGLTWFMTQTSKLDLTHADQRGLVVGLNEFFGYVGVAIAGIVTGYIAAMLGARAGLFYFGSAVIGLGTLLAWRSIVETLPWTQAEMKQGSTTTLLLRPRYATLSSDHPSTRELFFLMSWGDRRMATLCQAGLVEKFVDALIWALLPVYLYQQGVSLPGIGWIVSAYGFTWGATQLFTGKLSDRFGRLQLNIWGMWICGAGVALMPLGASPAWWSMSAAIAGLGMAMLYPNLIAAVADIARPTWRASAIGIYRFWRDLGYGIGALGVGLAATLSGHAEAAFYFVALSMALSGGVLFVWGEETHPRLNPAN